MHVFLGHLFSYAAKHSRSLSTMGSAGYRDFQGLYHLHCKGLHVSEDQLYMLLTKSSNKEDIEQLRDIHALAIFMGLNKVGTLADHFIRLFALNCHWLESDLAFCNVEYLTVYTWHSIMTSHSKLCDNGWVLQSYMRMQHEGLQPNKYIFSIILKACANMYNSTKGKQVHMHMVKQGVEIDIVLGSVLIDVYIKCGEMNEAMEIFLKMPNKNGVTCNIILAGLVQHKCNICAFELLHEMLFQGFEVSVVTFLSVMKACINLGSITKARSVHDLCVRLGYDCNVSIQCALVDLYAKCKSMVESLNVFESLPRKSVVLWNALISGCYQQGYEQLAIEHFERMQKDGIKPDETTLSSVASACGNIGSVQQGQLVYDQVIRNSIHVDAVLGNTLLNMYGKWGWLEDARNVFEKLNLKDITAWNVMISAYNQHGFYKLSIQLFYAMHQQCLQPNATTLSCMLKTSGCLKDVALGRVLHDYSVKNGWSHDLLVGNSLIEMYVQCGRLEETSLAFKGLAKRNASSWNAFITVHLLHGFTSKAFSIFVNMLKDEVQPDEVSIICLLKYSGTSKEMNMGMMAHVWILNSDLQSSIGLENMLLDMYMKCSLLEEAYAAFHSMNEHDIVSWGIMIKGYTDHGHYTNVLKHFCGMQQQELELSPILLSCVLKACGSVNDIQSGWLVHDEIVIRNFELSTCIGNNLVEMYTKCGALEDASVMFKGLSNRDIVTWNTMITACAQKGFNDLAINVFKELVLIADLLPNQITYSCILNVCANKKSLELGWFIHAQVCENDYHFDTIVRNTLVNMYFVCGALEDALSVFDNANNKDVVAWNTMLVGYIDRGCEATAIKLFEKMQEKGVHPDKTTFSSILKAYGSRKLIEQGAKIHMELVENRFVLDSTLGNSVVGLYIRCGSLEMAKEVFNNLHFRNTVTFNTMISGCLQHEQGFSALKYFEEMEQDGLKPDEVTFLSTIKATVQVGALKYGRWIHEQILRHGFDSNQMIGNTLVTMYSMCGSLGEATKLFWTLPNQNAVCWGALLSGYSKHGTLVQALHCLEQMQQQGFKPVHMMFANILSACSHQGKVQEGHAIFEAMKKQYDIQPDIIHYNCMLQLYGYTGHLKRAENMLRTMPSVADLNSWMTLLIACRSVGEVRMGGACNEVLVADQNVEDIL
ncbi:hypothetical protein KP509_13G086700 [Ceratopteris richardii]|uniref:Pentatricopeptide repeat-containing protein n=1 Tax=Ceratopteris richardii TaxID=49495 RepID=A0A8T2THN1_CERRI|nr:hypothetical protein KP509_13G086700 [Ceratopteris richardii]KAH7422021.1 hypothetical protein KP509_13G086700 [Ceratopteris richardii]